MSPWSRAILHVDMDAFFASVEQLDNPEYRGKPLIVGGASSKRGVVAAASYEIRAYGVRSAMPTGKALKLCPHAILVPPRMQRYREVSQSIFEIFYRYTPLVQSVSLDEAFLDVTGSQLLHGSPVHIAKQIKEAVSIETGLTASVGVATCRFVAKIASDLDKPDGLTIIPESEMLDRLAVLPVSKIWGVGPVTNNKLQKLGITTIAQLRSWPREPLITEFGQSGGELYDLAHGIDNSAVISDEESEDKSISHEETFSSDITDIAALETVLHQHADRVATRLRKQNLAGRIVFIKLRYHDFTTLTRRITLPEATELGELIFRYGRELLRTRTDAGKRPVRLLGVGVGGLSHKGDTQGVLFKEESSCPDQSLDKNHLRRLERLERVTDAIRDKLGSQAIQRASTKFRKDS